MTILDSIDSTLYPSRFDLVFRALWCYIPEPLLYYVRYFPFREYRRFRTFLDFSDSYSRGIISDNKDKSDGKDMISVLLRANAAENSTNKMTDSEVVSQITWVIPQDDSSRLHAHAFPVYSTLLLAGHETTSNTLAWFLWEVAKHPESQERIREEIAVLRKRVGRNPFSAADLDNMTYTQAALKVKLMPFCGNSPFPMIDPSRSGVNEAAPHHLDTSKSCGKRRRDPFGLPYHNEVR